MSLYPPESKTSWVDEQYMKEMIKQARKQAFDEAIEVCDNLQEVYPTSLVANACANGIRALKIAHD